MITSTWSQFITAHPQATELQAEASDLMNTFQNVSDTNDRIASMASITQTQSTVVLSLNPFTKEISATFAHRNVGFTLKGRDPVQCLALQGFGNSAFPTLLDNTKLMSVTDTDYATPTLSEIMSVADAEDPKEHLKGLEASNTVNPAPIHLAAILPPILSIAVSELKDLTTWDVLETIIKEVASLRPAEMEDENDTTYAQPYLELLRTLWVFCNHGNVNGAETTLCTPQTVAHSSFHSAWCRDMHATHLTSPSQPSHQIIQNSTDIASDALAKIANSLSSPSKARFASNPDDEEEEDDDESTKQKAWKKLDKSLQKAHLFACSTSGVTFPAKPPQRFLQLLASKSTPLAIRYFQHWHPRTGIVVMPGMVANIIKGLLTSNPDEFAIDTFSPFFCPPASAGFTNISNDELNSIELSSTSFNLSQSDIKKMTTCKPYVPTNHYLLKKQVKNFQAVLEDCFGEDSLIASIVRDVADHMEKNENKYEHIISEFKYFPVWILNVMHYKVQSIIHACHQAEDVEDVQFEQFTMAQELKQINTMTFVAIAPKWYLEEETKALERQRKEEKTNQATQSSPKGSSNRFNRSNNTSNEDSKRTKVENENIDPIVALKSNESYASIVHWQNLKQFEPLAVKINGEYVCNNFHMRGFCHNMCKRATTHTKLSGEQRGKYRRYTASLRKGAAQFRAKKGNQAQPNHDKSSEGENNAQNNPEEGEN